MKVIMENVHADRAKWLELRRNSIGSSDIATIAGLNQYRSVLELWAEKTGKVEPFGGNDATWLGQQMEPVIGRFFARKNPQFDVSACIQMFRHEELPFVTANPDFFLGKVTPHGESYEIAGLLETKNANFRKLAEWQEKAPTWVQIQLQWQLGVLKLSGGYVAGLVGANAFDFKQFECEFSPEVFDQCLQLATEFWSFVQKDIPPNAGPGDKKLVEKIIGEREEGKVTGLPVTAYPLVKEYLRACRLLTELNANVKGAKSEKDALEARILQLMGNAERAEFFGVALKASRQKQPEKKIPAFEYTRMYVKGELEDVDSIPVPGDGMPVAVYHNPFNAPLEVINGEEHESNFDA